MPNSTSPVEQDEHVRRTDDSTEFVRIIKSASKVGATSGACGIFVGAISGILLSSRPIVFSLASGIQCSFLGATITLFRESTIKLLGKDHISSNEKLLVSSIAGALGGGVSGALFRNRTNVIPGAIMFAIFGFTGQTIYNKFENRVSRQDYKSFTDVKSWTKPVWSPVSFISDEQYKTILNNKLLQTRAEIARIDEKIKALRIDQK